MVLEVLVVDDVVVSLVAVDDRFFVFLFFDDNTHIFEVIFSELFVGDDIIVVEIGWQLCGLIYF